MLTECEKENNLKKLVLRVQKTEIGGETGKTDNRIATLGEGQVC